MSNDVCCYINKKHELRCFAHGLSVDDLPKLFKQMRSEIDGLHKRVKDIEELKDLLFEKKEKLKRLENEREILLDSL